MAGSGWKSPYGMSAPCMECGERSIGCHTDCRAYLEYKKKNQELHHRKKMENMGLAYHNERVSQVKAKKSRQKNRLRTHR